MHGCRASAWRIRRGPAARPPSAPASAVASMCCSITLVCSPLPPQDSTTVDVPGLNQQGFLAGGGIPPNASAGALTQADARAETSGYIPNQVRPESLQWNIGIQHVFHKNYTIESRYLGTRGIHLPVQAQLDRIPAVNASNALPIYSTAPSQATLNGLTSTLAKLTAISSLDPAYSAAGFAEHHHLLYALGQLHLSRLGQPVHAPLLQRPAVHGRLHLQPQYRRFHGRSVQHVHHAAPSAEYSRPGRRPGQFGAGSPEPLHLSGSV